MAYSELIKSFSKIREYMSQFYVYGFKSRNEYNSKSARSYDNERRRMESWLGDYMFFRQNANGKNTFISVDSQTVSHNPLYKAFKAKSFTPNDITLHFYIMDILADNKFRSIKEITNLISNDYLPMFSKPRELDESTIRKKLKEYERLGLLESTKHGKELVFRRMQDNVNLESWQDAVNFYSEEDSLGVVGSYILDKYDDTYDCFSFKHHYILHALESEILYSLFIAIREHKAVELEVYSTKKSNVTQHSVLPLKIYISTQGGRRYLMAHQYGLKRITFYRLDSIKKITLKEYEPDYSKYYDITQRFKNRLWGVSVGKGYRLEHIEMTVFVGEKEGYIVNRLEREKRCGTTEKLDERHYKFSADVYDAMELMPWIRTFIGRITKLESSNDEVVSIFYSDLEKMKKLYGGDGDAVQ
ncbi:MAG: WYL domain-containing protein [Eubacterium sp.]|nr:WYL domain-containing protein [Eubacterium sp.]